MEMGALDHKNKLGETLSDMAKTLKIIQEEITSIKTGGRTRVPRADMPPRDRNCFRCGNAGHIRRNCPQNLQGGGDRPTQRPLPSATHPNGRLQKMERTMIHLQQQMAALDMGAPPPPDLDDAEGNVDQGGLN